MKEIVIPSLWPVTCHTDHVSNGGTFVAVKGQRLDGVDFIAQALKKGAKTIIADVMADISLETQELIKQAQAELAFVEHPRRTLAFAAAQAWGNPADELKILAITGTKGKTTTAWLLHHLLLQAGKRVALLCTVKNKIMDQEFPTELTTQHPDYLHAFFHACVREKIEYVVMEVAAQAHSLHRIAGLLFDGLIFTNFSPAHGEFYATEQDYLDAKKAIVDYLKPDAPLLMNADDMMCQTLMAHHASTIAFSLSPLGSMEVLSEALAESLDRMETSPLTPEEVLSKRTEKIKGTFSAESSLITGSIEHQNSTMAFACPSLIGDFNKYNVLAAAGLCLKLGICSEAISKGLHTFEGVPGRLEKYQLPNGARCFIDYAHNPLSFRAVLQLLRSQAEHLIVVAGAGGDRDQSMRPELGYIMAEYADHVILTADNPRSENPADIIAAIHQGIPLQQREKVLCELDREVAIKTAYQLSNNNSIIALLGKGPEQYQIVGTTKFPFSERAIIKQLFL